MLLQVHFEQESRRRRKHAAINALFGYVDVEVSRLTLEDALTEVRNAFFPQPPANPRPRHRPQGSGTYPDRDAFLQVLVPTIQQLHAEGRYPSQPAVAAHWPEDTSGKQIGRWFARWCTGPLGWTWEMVVQWTQHLPK